MSSVQSRDFAINTESRPSRYAGRDVSVVICCFAAFMGVRFIASNVVDGMPLTLGMYLIALMGGAVLVAMTAKHLRDPKLNYLTPAFCLKLLFLLLFLYRPWTSRLDMRLPSFGGDQERFFFQSYDLAVSGFRLDALPDLNYTGILFLYGALFAVFGHNAVAPAIFNAFVTLCATLILVRVGYFLRERNTKYDWMLGLAMVVPEVMWYDVLTGRETIVMSLIVFSTLGVVSDICRPKGGGGGMSSWMVLALIAMFSLGAIRTSMLLPVFLALGGYFYFLKSGRGSVVLGFVLMISGAFLLVAPGMAESLGSTSFSFLNTLQDLSTNDAQYLSHFDWAQNSIGLLLIPDNPLQAVLYVLPRLILYFVAPWPNVTLSMSGLISGVWADWQALMVGSSSLIYIFLMPFALASLFGDIKKSGASRTMILQLPCWLTLLSVAGGNLTIHERYRLMAVLPFCGCAWLGFRCARKEILRAAFLWVGVLGISACGYVVYKMSI